MFPKLNGWFYNVRAATATMRACFSCVTLRLLCGSGHMERLAPSNHC